MKIKIKVIPSSSKDCFAGYLGDVLKVKIKAPPERGKANKAVSKFMENQLGLPRGSVQILTGHTSAIKIIQITCHDVEVIYKKLTCIDNNQS